ncbi:MAG: pentapeptide repeat-containing protein [Polyangiaceae bacterium]
MPALATKANSAPTGTPQVPQCRSAAIKTRQPTAPINVISGPRHKGDARGGRGGGGGSRSFVAASSRLTPSALESTGSAALGSAALGSGARLSGARLSGARLSGARLSGARLSGARLGSAARTSASLALSCSVAITPARAAHCSGRKSLRKLTPKWRVSYQQTGR